jgi:hypothetical protein
MGSFDAGKELGRAVIAAIVALVVATFLKALGAGRWVVAVGSGAVGGLAAAAAIV